jgi:hypothetical protein
MDTVDIRLVSTQRNLAEDLALRKQYCQALLEATNKDERIFYLDEMAINRWVGREKIWAKPEEPMKNVMLPLKKESFLLVSLMNEEGKIKF